MQAAVRLAAKTRASRVDEGVGRRHMQAAMRAGEDAFRVGIHVCRRARSATHAVLQALLLCMVKLSLKIRQTAERERRNENVAKM